MAEVRIGTSGWVYRHWREVFYPLRLPQRAWFEHYATQFDTVEVNATFYRLPPETTFFSWRRRAPEGFLFALKAPRVITHLKRLTDCQQDLELFLSRAWLLGDRLGPILFQLPPRWEVDAARLRALLALLPPEGRWAFEFRDPSWLCEPVYQALRERGAALVRVSARRFPDAAVSTANLQYLRMHGDQTTYASKYSLAALEGWAHQVANWLAVGQDVFAYLNNDAHGYAVEDARALRDLVTRRCSA